MDFLTHLHNESSSSADDDNDYSCIFRERDQGEGAVNLGKQVYAPGQMND